MEETKKLEGGERQEWLPLSRPPTRIRSVAIPNQILQVLVYLYCRLYTRKNNTSIMLAIEFEF